MRKGVQHLESSRCRLLSLLLVLLLSLLGANTVHGSSSNPNHLGNIKKDSNFPTGGPSYERVYRLVSRCTDKYVQILGGGRRGRVNARGRERNHNSTLVKFESHPSGGGKIYIKGVDTKRFLCFNRRGRLILRHVGTRPTCVFKEEFTEDNYTRLQSAANPSWYVGFGRKGKRLKGYLIKKPGKQKCFHFLPKLWQSRPRKTGRKSFSPLDKSNRRNIHLLLKRNRRKKP